MGREEGVLYFISAPEEQQYSSNSLPFHRLKWMELSDRAHPPNSGSLYY